MKFRTQRECFLWIQTFGQLELLDSTSGCLMKGLHPAQRAPLHEGVKGEWKGHKGEWFMHSLMFQFPHSLGMNEINSWL